MAEVIRRGFQDAFDERWPEEYEATGHWVKGARERIFGAERPLDTTMRTKPFVAREFGLFTGSSVRWYVEGNTEYFAFLELLCEPWNYGIELINLQGEIAAGAQGEYSGKATMYAAGGSPFAALQHDLAG